MYEGASVHLAWKHVVVCLNKWCKTREMYTAKECVLLIEDPKKGTYNKQDLLQIVCKITANCV
jgi:hypothetical protein